MLRHARSGGSGQRAHLYIQCTTYLKDVSMKLIISQRVRSKLQDKHNVSEKEVEECFENRMGRDLFDTREEHKTDPPTRWFLSCTNHQRLLKVGFVPSKKGMEIKTAYDANQTEISIYKKHGWS